MPLGIVCSGCTSVLLSVCLYSTLVFMNTMTVEER